MPFVIVIHPFASLYSTIFFNTGLFFMFLLNLYPSMPRFEYIGSIPIASDFFI